MEKNEYVRLVKAEKEIVNDKVQTRYSCAFKDTPECLLHKEDRIVTGCNDCPMLVAIFGQLYEFEQSFVE